MQGSERDAERLHPGGPHEQEIGVRLATVRVGIGLTLIVCAGGLIYTLETWGRPNRAFITVVLALGILSALIIRLLPTERIIRSRWREPFFVGWSAADIAMIAAVAAADGGARSPFTLLFVLPFIFGALSYPLPYTIMLGAIDIGAFVAVAVGAGGGSIYSSFTAFALICTALMSSWEAKNQGARRLALAHTAAALKTSEETSSLRARQQEEVARFGQQALGQPDIRVLLDQAVQIVRRVLSTDMAAVLRQVPDEKELEIIATAGIGEEEAVGQRVPAGVHSQAGYTLIGGAPVVVEDWEQETRFARPQVLSEPGMRSGLTAIIPTHREPYGVLGTQARRRSAFGSEDISFMEAIANVLASAIERRAKEERTHYEALHDSLTGLANRNLFLDRLRHALVRAEQRGSSVAVLFLDLDQFKLVNDSLGHATGDRLLAAVAPRLEHVLRPGDTVARFGGDEFAVLAEDLPSERAATQLAERIAAALVRPFIVEGRQHFVSASVGISMGCGGEPPEELVRDADAALYRAKEKGRGAYEIFDQVMRSRVLEHMHTENELRGAIARDELELHYQPIVHLADNSIAWVEALLRWRHPERGLLGPAAFIRVAEESGLIEELGHWVIERACNEAAAWQALDPDARPVGISVNLSAPQLTDPELPRIVSRALKRSGIDPSTLHLELTERVALEPEVPLESVYTLKELGVQLVLDDFGIGSSSLGYLKRLPLDVIKLDRSFIENLVAGTADTAIVMAVVQMAGALGMRVVAEGVETAKQLEAVRSLGCDQAQGFYFAHPAPASELTELLSAPSPFGAPARSERGPASYL